MRRSLAVALALLFGTLAPAAVVAEEADPAVAPSATGGPAAATEEALPAQPAAPSIDELLGPIGGRTDEPTETDAPPPDEPLPGPSVAELLGPAPAFEPDEPPPDNGVNRLWFWSLTGLAIAAGVGGGITGGLVLGAEDEYDVALGACRLGSAAACADGPRIVSDFEDYRLATNVLLFSAGGLAVAAFVLAFFTDFGLPPPMDDTPLAPLFGMSSGGATLSWNF